MLNGFQTTKTVVFYLYLVNIMFYSDNHEVSSSAQAMIGPVIFPCNLNYVSIPPPFLD